ncbi:MAG: copper resistance protein NlpE N-terminal domain-containing protein [Bdellovibrionaceae bacterium]|nr:copper resistance protein NlpE N-terminal domain-containing protein [Pseudobdellovibrionaceae bacterium]
MKSLITSTVAMIATLSVLSACNSNSSSKDLGNIASPDAKVEAQSVTLTGVYNGVSAVCAGGTEAPGDDAPTKATVLTFNADGTYKTNRTVPNSKTDDTLETAGKYTVDKDVLTLNQESQIYEGNIGFVSVKTEATFKLEGTKLTVNVPHNEDSSCPADEALMITYTKQEPKQEVATTPVPSEQPSPEKAP